MITVVLSNINKNEYEPLIISGKLYGLNSKGKIYRVDESEYELTLNNKLNVTHIELPKVGTNLVARCLFTAEIKDGLLINIRVTNIGTCRQISDLQKVNL